MGRDVVLVSSADETAFAVRELLADARRSPRTPCRGRAAHTFLTSGDVDDVPRPRRTVPRSRGRRRVEAWRVELTVLGCSGSFGAPHGPCSGYLVRARRHRDLARLRQRHLSGTSRQHLAVEDLTAVVITHEHPDHCVDIYGLHVLLRYGHRARGLPVSRPEGLERALAPLVPATGATRSPGDDHRRRRRRDDRRRRRSASPAPTTRRRRTRSRRAQEAAASCTRPTPGPTGASTRSARAPSSCCRRRRISTSTVRRRSTSRRERPAAAARAAACAAAGPDPPLAAPRPATVGDEGSEAFGAPVTLAARGMVMTV